MNAFKNWVQSSTNLGSYFTNDYIFPNVGIMSKDCCKNLVPKMSIDSLGK